MGREKFKDSDRGMDSSQRIAREILDLMHNWYSEGIGKTYISSTKNSAE